MVCIHLNACSKSKHGFWLQVTYISGCKKDCGQSNITPIEHNVRLKFDPLCEIGTKNIHGTWTKFSVIMWPTVTQSCNQLTSFMQDAPRVNNPLCCEFCCIKFCAHALSWTSWFYNLKTSDLFQTQQRVVMGILWTFWILCDSCMLENQADNKITINSLGVHSWQTFTKPK